MPTTLAGILGKMRQCNITRSLLIKSLGNIIMFVAGNLPGTAFAALRFKLHHTSFPLSQKQSFDFTINDGGVSLCRKTF